MAITRPVSATALRKSAGGSRRAAMPPAWRLPERYLLAFVYGYLGEHDLLRARTDAEKYLMLACPNLVECVAYVGAQLQSR